MFSKKKDRKPNNKFTCSFNEKGVLKDVSLGVDANQILGQIKLTNPAACFADRMNRGGYKNTSERKIGLDAEAANILSNLWNGAYNMNAKAVISKLMCKVVEDGKQLEHQKEQIEFLKIKNDFLKNIMMISSSLSRMRSNDIDGLEAPWLRESCNKKLADAMFALAELYQEIEYSNAWSYKERDLFSFDIFCREVKDLRSKLEGLKKSGFPDLKNQENDFEITDNDIFGEDNCDWFEPMVPEETVTENQEIKAEKDENETVSKSDSDDVAAYIF